VLFFVYLLYVRYIRISYILHYYFTLYGWKNQVIFTYFIAPEFMFFIQAVLAFAHVPGKMGNMGGLKSLIFTGKSLETVSNGGM